jgi:hypothetical protein
MLSLCCCWWWCCCHCVVVVVVVVVDCDGTPDAVTLHVAVTVRDTLLVSARSGCETYERLAFVYDELHFRIESGLPTTGSFSSAASTAADSAGGKGSDGDDDDDVDAAPLVVSHTPRLGKSAVAMVEEWHAILTGAGRVASPTLSSPTAADGGGGGGGGGSGAAAVAVAAAAAVGGTVGDGGGAAAASAPAATPVAVPAVTTVAAPAAGAGVSAPPQKAPLPSIGVRAPHFVAPLLGLVGSRSSGAAAPAPPPDLLCALSKVRADSMLPPSRVVVTAVQ